MATFLWALQWGGLTIALVGLSRERWLTRRHASRLSRRQPPLTQPL